MHEQKSLPSETTMGGKERKLNDSNYTIAYLLKTGSIPNGEQASFQEYMIRIQEMDIKYTDLIAKWPFLVAQRLLKMQSSRLRVIKSALAEKLNDHPLNINNATGFNNPNANTGADTYSLAGFNNPQGDYMSAGVDLAMFQRGGAEDQQSQSAIRPGQEDLGDRGQ